MIKNTLQSRLTIYSILLIMVTTFSAVVGAIFVKIYQTQREHHLRLQGALE